MTRVPSIINAPWTAEQVDNLNAFQARAEFHPFTCGGNRDDAAHRQYAEESGAPDWGILVAEADGWRCPVCGYRQDWAHGFMAAPAREEAHEYRGGDRD